MKVQSLSVLSVILFFAIASCNKYAEQSGKISENDVKNYLSVIANDSLQGRKPFTVGEDKTIRYLSDEFKKLGLEPANKGSYFQDVPMVEVTSKPAGDLKLSGKSNLSLKPYTDFVAGSRQELETINIQNSPLVFAGYGIVAPEYQWNDYAGLDVKGKTVIVLVNDPGFKSNDPSLFHGDTMTYYGRWTYKYEEAARQGAAGVLIIHQTEPASYPWHVVNNSFSGAKLYLQQSDKHMSRCKVEGWITEEASTKLLAAAGITGDFRALARKKGFKAIPLNTSMSLVLNNKLKYSTSHNVAALIKGTKRPDECVIYSAHWDHFGKGKPDAKGDSIYNGAVDNGTGTAALLSMAKAFSKSEKPERSILFLAVTGEEQGLLGSEYYAAHPLFPLNKTVADLNMDALHPFGETTDVAVTGKGQNELEDYVEDIVEENGKHTIGDTKPGAGSYYRSDHFNFAKVGVPALDINTGIESVLHGADWGKAQSKSYNDDNYHQPSDNFSLIKDYGGITQIANILYQIGWKLGNETTFPGWKNGSEFKAVRDKSMKN
ncbi:M28 family peptidase [Pedobacter sp. HMF7647]|uniref:M28 family peptidase n=1 Tax=Hufsiella arboris TaxID=2695275 RepID=A0A7K1YCF2_9SPHI|nr:M28 family metallopeptidase [Hufsiella arboris]MXV52263.1 M28 family peptidase [Hufsiella arboris]